MHGRVLIEDADTDADADADSDADVWGKSNTLGHILGHSQPAARSTQHGIKCIHRAFKVSIVTTAPTLQLFKVCWWLLKHSRVHGVYLEAED